MRAQSEIETRILGMIEPPAKALGLEVVRVRVMGRDEPTLQIMVERPDGTIDVGSCATYSRALSPILEKADPISGHYSLEVSSPGIDRPLTRSGDFARWIGHEARVELGAPQADGRKRFHGVIVGETDGVASLSLKDGGEAQIALADMIKASLVLTDKLIKTAQAKGLVADETDEGFDDVEVEDEIEDEDGALTRASGEEE